MHNKLLELLDTSGIHRETESFSTDPRSALEHLQVKSSFPSSDLSVIYTELHCVWKKASPYSLIGLNSAKMLTNFRNYFTDDMLNMVGLLTVTSLLIYCLVRFNKMKIDQHIAEIILSEII